MTRPGSALATAGAVNREPVKNAIESWFLKTIYTTGMGMPVSRNPIPDSSSQWTRGAPKSSNRQDVVTIWL